MKKVAIVSDRVYPYFKGGAEKRYWEISNHLSKMGYEIKYLTGQWSGMPKQIIIDGIKLKGVYKVGDFYKNGKKSIWETLKYTLSLVRYLAFEQYDLIECEQFPILPIFLCKLFSFLRRKAFIVTWHEVWGKELWSQYLGFWGMIGAAIERISVHLPDRIISVSPHTTCKLNNLYRVPLEKIETIPNGIDLRWDLRARNRQTGGFQNCGNFIIEKRTPVETSDIIYVGRLLEHKNVDILIRAVKVLKSDNPEIKCIIVGDGPERSKLEELVISLKLENNIHFLGFLCNEKRVYSYMKSSHVFVLPSTREGFGISVLEANACGLPALVIKNENNAACDLIKNGVNGFICSFDEAKIANLIDYILKTPLYHFEDGCKKIAQSYAWKGISDRVNDLYCELLNGGGKNPEVIAEPLLDGRSFNKTSVQS